MCYLRKDLFRLKEQGDYLLLSLPSVLGYLWAPSWRLVDWEQSRVGCVWRCHHRNLHLQKAGAWTEVSGAISFNRQEQGVKLCAIDELPLMNRVVQVFIVRFPPVKIVNGTCKITCLLKVWPEFLGHIQPLLLPVHLHFTPLSNLCLRRSVTWQLNYLIFYLYYLSKLISSIQSY